MDESEVKRIAGDVGGRGGGVIINCGGVLCGRENLKMMLICFGVGPLVLKLGNPLQGKFTLNRR